MTPQQRAEIESIAKSGNLIGAIKEYRRITGVGLAEAKDAVELIRSGGQVELPAHPPASNLSGAIPLDQIKDLLSKGKKIDAIRIYREATSSSLQEAKEEVERIEQQQRAGVAGKPGVQKQGCFGVLVVGGLVVAVLLERFL